MAAESTPLLRRALPRLTDLTAPSPDEQIMGAADFADKLTIPL